MKEGDERTEVGLEANPVASLHQRELTPAVHGETDEAAAALAASAGPPATARDAFEQQDGAGSIAVHNRNHETGALLNNEKHSMFSDRLKSIVYGGLDGIITTFAVVSGATGGGFGVDVIMVLGFSNMVADALSMGVGDAMSTKAENDAIMKERAREAWELENFKEGEILEMVDLYEEKGMSRFDAEMVIRIMAKYEDFFIDRMMMDELELMVPDPDDSPWADGFVTFCSFIFFGMFPLLAYACTIGMNLEVRTLFGISCGLTVIMLFVLGAIKSLFTNQAWWKSVLEITAVGSFTAVVSFLIGWMIEDLIISSDSALGGLH